MTQTSDRPLVNRQVLFGGALMALGVALFAGAHTGLDINLWKTGWAVMLFVVGVTRFIDPRVGNDERPSRRTGAWLMTVGAWGFASGNRLFGLSFGNSWPVLLVAAGVITVWWAIDESRHGLPKGGARW